MGTYPQVEDWVIVVLLLGQTFVRCDCDGLVEGNSHDSSEILGIYSHPEELLPGLHNFLLRVAMTSSAGTEQPVH